MNIKKIKYCFAVAILVIATAFCGCEDNKEELIPVGEPVKETVGETPKQEDVPASVTVYVCGAVVNADVYDLPPNSRIVDAVNAAGGVTDDAGIEYLNLASPISDGQKVYIPTVSQIEEALEAGEEIYGAEVNITSNAIEARSQSGDGSGMASDGLVDINSADKSTLMTLPGIGESKADRIITYREQNGAFSSIEDIMLVGGIKEGLFNKVKDRICVR